MSLEGALAEFELVINQSKTSILELPSPIDDPWKHEISRFPVRDPRETSQAQALNDVISLFAHATAAATEKAGALKYTLLRSRSVYIGASMWPRFQSLVWMAVSSEPTTMATALDLLAQKSDEAGELVDKDGAAEVIEALLAVHAPLRNSSEVAWALWAAIQLRVPLSGDAAGRVAGMSDNFVALLALHADQDNLFAHPGLDKAHWEELIDADSALSSPNWVLAYEASVRGWLEGAATRVDADPFFRTLAKLNVRFYDTDPPTAPFTGPAGPMPGSSLPDDYL